MSWPPAVKRQETTSLFLSAARHHRDGLATHERRISGADHHVARSWPSTTRRATHGTTRTRSTCCCGGASTAGARSRTCKFKLSSRWMSWASGNPAPVQDRDTGTITAPYGCRPAARPRCCTMAPTPTPAGASDRTICASTSRAPRAGSTTAATSCSPASTWIGSRTAPTHRLCALTVCSRTATLPSHGCVGGRLLSPARAPAPPGCSGFCALPLQETTGDHRR